MYFQNSSFWHCSLQTKVPADLKTKPQTYNLNTNSKYSMQIVHEYIIVHSVIDKALFKTLDIKHASIVTKI